jgi:hypothetical protein
MRREPRTGWSAVLLWALAFAALALSLLSWLVAFLLPVAVVLTVVVARVARGWPEAIGGVAGPGVLALVIALSRTGETPCPAGPHTDTLRLGESRSCGHARPGPWYAVGAALVVIGLAGYRAAGGRA